jgi:hypothetical protein
VQSAILDAVATGGVHPLLAIAADNGYDPATVSVRQSFARAARALADAREVHLWDLSVPTAHNELSGFTNYRDIVCVSDTDDPTDEDWAVCRHAAMAVFFPEMMGRYERTVEQESYEDERTAQKVLDLLTDPHRPPDDEEITRERVVKLVASVPELAERADAIADRVMELLADEDES